MCMEEMIMTREEAKRILACRGNGYSEEDFNNAIEVAFNSIPSLLSDVNEAADKYTDNHANYLEYSDDGWEDKTDIDYVERAFKAGAEWLAGQGETLYDTINVDGKNQRWLGENLLYGDYNAGQAVIVQIRKL